MPDYRNALHASLRGHTLRRWEVLYIPVMIETRSAVTPDTLLRSATYRWVLSEPGAGIVVPRNVDFVSFLKLIENSTFGAALPANDYLDVRWGTRLLDENRKEVFSLYLDRLRDCAIVNNRMITVDPKVRRWLTAFTKRRFLS